MPRKVWEGLAIHLGSTVSGTVKTLHWGRRSLAKTLPEGLARGEWQACLT